MNASRPQSQLSALLFDSDESNARCRLYEQAERVWVCAADAAPEQIHHAINDIERAAHEGAHIVLSLSFEAYHAFSSAAHLPQQDKPQASAEIARTPALQAVAFHHMRHLDTASALRWLDEQSEGTDIHLSTPKVVITQAQFHANIADIRERIAAGQTYQVNLTYPYLSQLRAFVPPQSEHDANPDRALFAAFAQLVRAVNVPYAGLLLLPENSLLSFSPELFFELDGLQLRARPMKGTAPLGRNKRETERLATELANDPKNRAENLMILDLLRNDVARLAQTQHVSVPEKFTVKPYGAILQMTSTVQADLREQPSLLDLLDALFPCGSITGAPKHETIRIIQGLEPYARGAYCGAIGYVQRNAANPEQLDVRMNVAIRTLETTATPIVEPYGIARWPLQCSVGAGITYDSDAAAEWAECELKSQFLARHTAPFELIETMRLERDRCRQWDVPLTYLREHHKRMARSAQTLGFVWNEDAFFGSLHQARLQATEQSPSSTAHALRLRLALAPSGEFSTQIHALEPVRTAVFAVHPQRIDSTHPLRAHKTSMRRLYNDALTHAKAQGLFDYVFVNEKGEVAEGARSCVLVKIDGAWYTPPLHCGVLPSVARALALSDAHLRVQERILSIHDLRRAERIQLGNALYGWLPARESALLPLAPDAMI